MSEFYNGMGGAINSDLERIVHHELNPDDDQKQDPTKKGKKKWHLKLNRSVDKVLTHPIMEAGKTACRFVPGVGLFMIGVDRVTRWKLTYSNNVAMVSMLEKKMTDITITYISLVELLPPKDRCDENPRLKIFSKRADQVKRLVALIQKSISDYDLKSERERLAMAEVIQSSFKSLLGVLDELQRDISLHLNIQSTAGIQAQALKLDSIVHVLQAQRSVLESQGSRNDQLLALIQRQVNADFRMQASIDQIISSLTPGYAKVKNAEIRKVWWDFFRFPASLPTSEFLAQMPHYFKMEHDTVALGVWIELCNGLTISIADIGLDPDGILTPFDLNETFPADPVYEISIGDWLIWRTLGWIFLVIEIERSILPLRKQFIQSSVVVSRFIEFMSDMIHKVRNQHAYTAEVHARLLDISMRAISAARPPFADRFQSFVVALVDARDVLTGAFQDSKLAWFDANTQQTLAQTLATMQWRLLAESEDLGLSNACEVWTSDDLSEWMATDSMLTQRATESGTLFANTVWTHWNGNSALISPHAITQLQKLGTRSHVAHLYDTQPIVLTPLGSCTAEESVMAQIIESAANACAQWNICRNLVSTYGVTLVPSGCFMAVLEYCECGDLRSLLSGTAPPPISKEADLSQVNNSPATTRLSLVTKLKIMVNITKAIRFIHAKGATHQNLTSTHIYLTEGNVAKVGGLISSNSLKGGKVLRYRAPECFDGEEGSDWQSNDLYALGLIFLEILHGDPPHVHIPDIDVIGLKQAVSKFEPNERVPELFKQQHQRHNQHGPIPREMTDLIISALSVNPKDRCTMDEFSSTIEAICARQRQGPSNQLPVAAARTFPTIVPVEKSVAVENVESVVGPIENPPSYQIAVTAAPHTTVRRGVEPVPQRELSLSEIETLVDSIKDPTQDLVLTERKLRTLGEQHPRALFHLGDLYYYDHSPRGIPNDFSRAFKIYTQSLDQGETIAAVGVADCYYFGLAGKAKQPGLARDLYVRALQSVTGALKATIPNTCARVYAGMGDVHFDMHEYDTALAHYYNAVDLNDACLRAWARIGDANLFGYGTPVDLDHARKCYRKAKGSRREVLGMIEYYRSRGEFAFANMYVNDPLLVTPEC